MEGDRGPRPKKQQKLSRACSVCSGPAASHVHYGAVSCYSCRAFFRRGIGKPYCCVEGKGDCTIDSASRRSCQWCRFDKCLRVGMRQDLVDASLRRKGGVQEQEIIPSFQSIEQQDVLAQVLLEIDKGISEPGSAHTAGYREVDLLGEELQYSVVEYADGELSYEVQCGVLGPGSSTELQFSGAELYTLSSPSDSGGSAELQSEFSPGGSSSPAYSYSSSSSSPTSTTAHHQTGQGLDIESLVDQCFLEEAIEGV